MYTSKISSTNVSYTNNSNSRVINNHPNPYAYIPLSAFGGTGPSKPANTESVVRDIENSQSIIGGGTEEEDIVVPEQTNPRRSVGSNQGSNHSKKSMRDEDFSTEKPKSFFTKFGKALCCCLPWFKKPENPLSCERDEDDRDLEENLV